MLPERPVLTSTQVAKAETRVGFSHPVISVIDGNLPTILELNKGYAAISDNQEQQRYIDRHYGFFADALVEALPFTLKPTDLISIWSRAIEIFSGSHRYALAGMVSSAYVIQGLENSEWRTVPRHLLETGQIPVGFLNDSRGLLHVKDRFGEVKDSLKEIYFYVYGIKGSATEYAAQLDRREKDGDTEAREELDKLEAYQNAHLTPVLGELLENFQNGLAPLAYELTDWLEVFALEEE